MDGSELHSERQALKKSALKVMLMHMMLMPRGDVDDGRPAAAGVVVGRSLLTCDMIDGNGINLVGVHLSHALSLFAALSHTPAHVHTQPRTDSTCLKCTL